MTVPLKSEATSANRNLRMTWEQAMSEAASREWHLIAEGLFDEVEAGDVKVDEADVAFLIRMATDPTTTAVLANTAIRLMGMLAEESLVSREDVLPRLRDLLSHDDPWRVYYAVKALWQARDRDALPALRLLRGREPSEDVASILQRAMWACR